MRRHTEVLLLVKLVLAAVLAQTIGLRCDRTPVGVSQLPSRADRRFQIEISGNPATYVPGEKYTIFLRGIPEHNTPYKFINFLLLVEHDSSETLSKSMRDPYVGTLQLFGDMLTKFSEKCPNAVTHTNTLPKTEIQVLWLAPPSGSGCVAIRATVVETRDIWYSEDGPLSKILCEEIQENEDIQPNVLRRCCACAEAKYEVTFEGLWSRNTHPKDFPSNNWLTRFSDIIGASHSVDYTFWNYGDIASEGLRQLAENGNTRMLESELKAKSEHIRTIIKARGIAYPNITGRTFAVFRVDSRHHLMSLVSMIHPSPDWIVGVSSLELCLRNCSWVESKTLNLYPWDAGTDDGPTYMSENQPSTPRQAIRRIKSNSPNDPRSPFYDEGGTEMKPLARLILSRQRLYEKQQCDQNLEYSEEDPHENYEYCEVTNWTDWSPCNVQCGKGIRYKQRGYKNKDSDSLKQHMVCKRKLTQRGVCYGPQVNCRYRKNNIKIDDPECELTPWGDWSSCSAICGDGTQTRSRRYKNRSAAKRCAAGNENSPSLEDNLPCNERNCENGVESQEIPHECTNRAWSEWSPCSSTCGKGIKIRRKLSVDTYNMQGHRRYRRSYSSDYEEDSDDETEDKYEYQDMCSQINETVECFNDERPTCEGYMLEDNELACGLPKDVGLCRSNVDRWYFDNIRGKCELFSYSGCEGNQNNFRMLEQCERVCSDYQKGLIANRTAQKLQLGATVSGVLSYNMQPQNDAAGHDNCDDENYGGIRAGDHTLDDIHNIIVTGTDSPVIDCRVTDWSSWTPCNATCGKKGIKTKSRTIMRHPSNGGKRCPSKLIKHKKCRVRCDSNKTALLPTWGPAGNEIRDCEVTEWSNWSPCSQTCGANAVRQRTRNIEQQPIGGGRPCPPRLEEIRCNLSACHRY